MKKFITKYLILSVFLITIVISCTSDDRDVPVEAPPPSGDYSNGVFILNEGNFGSVNASVSFLDATGVVLNSIFSNVNNANLGDTAQSMGFQGENAYIIVNNSATIEVVNRTTFERKATITNQIVNPRYIAFSGNKGFVSNWGDPNNVNDDYIAVINLNSNEVENSISVVEGPEKIVVHNEHIYVAHKGGFGYGNTISVIDISTQNVIDSISIADVPDGMVINNGFLYVTCTGKLPFTQDETLGAIFKIDTETNTVQSFFEFPEGVHPRFLEQAVNELYYVVESNVFSVETANFQIPTSPLLETLNQGVEILYGFNIHNGRIYVADAKDYVSNGEVFVYNLEGILQNQYTVSIIPNSFYFNNL